MIDEIGVLTGQKIIEIWGPPGIVIILLIALIALMYRFFMKQLDKKDTEVTYWQEELSKERDAHQKTIQEQKEDIRNLSRAGQAFLAATERQHSMTATLELLLRQLERLKA